jgi:hypothetical protein
LSDKEVRRTVLSIWQTHLRNNPDDPVPVISIGNEWEDPVPLDAAPQAKLPTLPGGVLVGWLGDMVNQVATATETPPEMAAALGL